MAGSTSPPSPKRLTGYPTFAYRHEQPRAGDPRDRTMIRVSVAHVKNQLSKYLHIAD